MAATKPNQRSNYERERERLARVAAQKSRSGRDIAPLPKVADPARKAAAKDSFEAFCRSYLPDTFNLPWSNDHRKAIDRIEKAIRTGGLYAYAFPRGSGKTSLAEAATLWATLYGYRQFPVVIGSDESAALELLDSIKTELENNDHLLGDFPEVCHPIRRLEGLSNRSAGQLHKGERTHIHWSAKEIVLPSIPGSPASGAVIMVTGITGRIRGMKFKRPSDGIAVRPDLVIIDDPQTDESAKSPTQSAERVRILCGAVLGLAGPGKRISGIMPCTVIHPGDMADQVLDREQRPEWQGERAKLVYRWPDAWDTLWQQYRKVRADGLRAGDNGKAGTEFYRANREAMDAGAETAWAVRFNPDELSAIQHAANLRFDLGEQAFAAEYQNQPIQQQEDTEALTADQIGQKTNGRQHRTVPLEAGKLVAYVDVQKTALFYSVLAFEDDFTGYIVDYGAFPDQRRDYFSLRDMKHTLQTVMKTQSLEGAIYAGLEALTDQLCGRAWQRDDGSETRIERMLIDANWGESSDVIYKFCRESAHAAVLTPSHGIGVGARSRPFNEYRKQKGDRVGDHWRQPAAKARMVRHVSYDTNHWKSFTAARWAVPIGAPGALSLFGDHSRNPQRHKMFADHQVAERPVRVEAKGRIVTEWELKNGRPDQHLLDCVVGAHVAASMQGVSLAERKAPEVRKAVRVKLSDLQKQKRDRRA